VSEHTVDARDEGHHDPDAIELWNESWYFDFATPDGTLGGYVRVGLYPNLGTVWYWAYLVGDGRPLVAVRDHEVPLPKAGSLEVRAEGLWSELVCETPLEHWSVNLEAFGVALDDPADAYRGERGHRVAVGLDLEWVEAAPAQASVGLPRYEQACVVQGEILLGDERIQVDAFGERDHSWGPRDWWTMPWCWTAGRLDDGTAFHAFRPRVGDDGHRRPAARRHPHRPRPGPARGARRSPEPVPAGPLPLRVAGRRPDGVGLDGVVPAAAGPRLISPRAAAT
jgi:hypothetical protein